MLISQGTTGALTVKDISAHLDLPEWNVARLVKVSRQLRGRKVKGLGTGRTGRGGRWEVRRGDYLNWLGVPEVDRAQPGPDGLPPLWPFEKAAAELHTTGDHLQQVVIRNRLPHVQVGRAQYLTASQLAIAREHVLRDATRR